MSWAQHAGDVLSGHGFRRGAARRSVVGLLAEQECCLSAQELYDLLRSRRRTVGLASVYRILEQLAQVGLVQRVDVGDGIARYERVDPAGEHHHHHAVCNDCGRVAAFSDGELERAIRRTADRLGFDASHEIVLRGACDDCATSGPVSGT